MSPRSIIILVGLLVAMLFVGFVCSLTREDFSGQVQETTTNTQAEQWLDFLDLNLKAIAVENDKIKFEATDYSKGLYLQKNDLKRVKSFARGISEDFFHSDNQAQVRFIVRRIEQDGIIVEYESKSKNRKHGNVMSLDRGAFKLEWKS